jgi:hypothetical protein
MSSLIHKLKTTYTTIKFTEAREFSWSPSTRTVFYIPGKAHGTHLLLHELSHALLDHREYRRDIELVAMETAAWEKAKELAKEYNVRIIEHVVQDHLDTYREWLHARSTCPRCSANGYQAEAFKYECAACSHKWRVNEARLCALRRYDLINAN